MSFRPTVLPAWVLAVSVVLLPACQDTAPTEAPNAPRFSSASGSVTVTSTAPDSASQDTTLNVHVFGSGFDRGSNAQWAQSGVVSPNVTTNSTQFVSSQELVANITIAITASTGFYDVLVTTSKGQKGIGTELFTVKKKTVPPANPAIAFVIMTNFGQTGNLWVMNADGSNQTLIASPAFVPSWAPFGDGTPANPYAIVFSPANCQISRINVAVVNGVPQGSNLQPLSIPLTGCYSLYPAWSPKGDTIAFSEGYSSNSTSSLWLMPATGGSAVAVYTAPAGSIVMWSAWRGDASQIAFIEQDASSNRYIKVLNRAVIPATVTTVLGPVSSSPRFIDWARTKDVLTFDAIPPFKSKCNYLYTLNLNPLGTPTQVTCGNYPAWSPDDSKLAFGGINVIDLGTAAVTQLSSGGTWPDWRR